MSEKPRLIFLAGPNGAGKSTFFELYLKDHGLPFINAEALASSFELSDTEAANAADSLREELLNEQLSFVTETVFSDPVGAKIGFLKRAMEAGYVVTLFYIGIASPQLSEARVAARVIRGGHDVPSDRLERLYRQSLKNLAEALPIVSEATVFENSSAEKPFRRALSVVAGKLSYRSTDFPTWAEVVLR